MRKLIIVLISLVFSTFAYSSQSMRRCMLLPINDSVGGAVGFPIYEEIEYYLKNSPWCYYRSNSEIIDILANYRNNLKSHLENKDVLKLLAEKTRAGALVRINLESHIEGIQVEMKVFGENGEDIYFSEKAVLEKDDTVVVSRTIKNWLDQYEKVIPYDGRIIGVLGDQFTLDIGKEYGLLNNTKINIIRPIQKKRHPLLKEVVEWETEEVGEGEIFHVIDLQSQARATTYRGQKRLKINDWIVLKEQGEDVEETKAPFEEDGNYNFGKIGKLGIGLILGSSSDTISSSNENITKIGGLTLGIDLDLELWLTRKYWIGIDIGQKFSSYKPQEGNVGFESNSVSLGAYKFKVGYKYLPLGFFYGPQVDFYTGYARYSYGLDTARDDGFSAVSFKGLMLGTKGSIPFLNKYRAYMEIDFIFSPTFREEVRIYGEDDSSSSFHIGLGAIYDYTPTMSFHGGLDFTNNKANFVNPIKELKLKESTATLGAIFTF